MFDPEPFPCRFCRHALDAHNLEDGCTNCICLATPGEGTPRTTEEQDLPILGPGEALPRYMRPIRVASEPEVLAVKEAERTSLAEAQRVGAIEQADAYLSTHRKSEVWSLINRLRDELVRAGRRS